MIRTATRLGLVSLALCFAVGGCTDSGGPPGADPAEAADATAPPRLERVDAAGRAPGEAPPRVLFLGTSLTAGYGLSADAAFPARLGELLAAQGAEIEVVNAGVSGDTSAGGLERLPWLLREPPDWIFVELGANDGLRGLPVEMTEANLREIIERSQAVGARSIVAGMLMPPNYGEEYTERFAALFPRVADETGSALVPFLLDGVAADPALNLADGIHPNAAGHGRIAESILPLFLELLTGEATLAPDLGP